MTQPKNEEFEDELILWQNMYAFHHDFVFFLFLFFSFINNEKSSQCDKIYQGSSNCICTDLVEN